MFLLYALNHNHAHSHALRFAGDTGDEPKGDEPKLDANMDELPEIEQGLKELEESAQIGSARSGPYWSKIRAKILSCSSTQDVEEALKEWSRNGSAWVRASGICELCGHNPISFHFPIQNRVTGSILVVGSECIYNYLKIPGFGSMEELRRRLNGERNRLKKKEMGQLSEEGLAIFQEATELEAQLRQRFAHLASGSGDFDVREYDNQVYTLDRLINGINSASPVLADIRAVGLAIRALHRIYNNLSKRSKLLKTNSLLAMVSATMRLRDDAMKLNILKQLQAAVNEMTKPGYPSDFIKRCWESVKDEKAGIIEKLDKGAEKQREKMRRYEVVLDVLKPYEFLHFSLIAGMNVARKMLSDEVEAAKALVLQEDFVEVVSKKGNPISVALSNASYDPMIRFNDPLITQAVQLTRLNEFIEYQLAGAVAYAVVRKYGLPGRDPKDRAGVKVACFRFFEDSIVEPTALSSAVRDVTGLIASDNKSVIDIIEQEVDDIKALKKVDFWEFLSERWDFNVQKALKVFMRDGGFEQSFCESLLKNWERWPKLSPKQMAIIQKKLTGRDKEVEDNMWDALKSKLTQPAPLG